jgi:hypothetical protein
MEQSGLTTIGSAVMISLSFTYIHLGLITIGLYKLSYARYMPANTTTRDKRPQGHASGIIDGMPIFAVISKKIAIVALMQQ